MRSTRFAVLLLAAVAALAACTTTSPTRRLDASYDLGAAPLASMPATATTKPGLAIARWWTTYDDPALDQLIGEALAHNQDLETALARVREAQAVVDQTRSAQLPTLDANWQSSRAQQSIAGATPTLPGFDRQSTNHHATLDAAYEVDLWGKLASTTASARYQLLASEWARASVEWSLTAQVAETYFALGAIDRQIEISESVRRSRQATVGLREREREAGTGNEFDLRRAESELTATEASLANLARQRVALESSLTLLLGRSPEEIVSGQLARRMLDERVPLANV